MSEDGQSFDWVDPNVLVFRGAFPPSRALIDAAEKTQKWIPSTIVDGDRPEYVGASRTNLTMLVSNAVDPSVGAFELPLRAVADAAFSVYRGDNVHIPPTKGPSPFQLLRYGEGQHFHVHCDMIYGHAVLEFRRLSMVFYLNDDYEGGELVFPRQKLTLKPRAGSLVLFPPSWDYPHASLDVKSGVKYCVVSWFF